MRIVPEEGENGLSVFSIAYTAMLEKLKRNYPEAEIWCLTLPQGKGGEFQGAVGRRIPDYCAAIRRCGARADCKVVDIYRPDQPYDTLDGYHPTAEGMKTIADAVLDELM
jgi:lysophospholipase L1-like esterase